MGRLKDLGGTFGSELGFLAAKHSAVEIYARVCHESHDFKKKEQKTKQNKIIYQTPDIFRVGDAGLLKMGMMKES